MPELIHVQNVLSLEGLRMKAGQAWAESINVHGFVSAVAQPSEQGGTWYAAEKKSSCHCTILEHQGILYLISGFNYINMIKYGEN